MKVVDEEVEEVAAALLALQRQAGGGVVPAVEDEPGAGAVRRQAVRSAEGEGGIEESSFSVIYLFLC